MKRGFTLIELLVVVLIIGILSSVALPQYTKAVERARAVEAITNIDAIYKAEQIYYMANGEYTTNLEDLDVEVTEKNYDFSVKFSDVSCAVFAHTKNTKDSLFFERNLETGFMVCVAGKSDTNSQALCKTFGTYYKTQSNLFYYDMARTRTATESE